MSKMLNSQLQPNYPPQKGRCFAKDRTYWCHKGKHQKLLEALKARGLYPVSGRARTMLGELFRSAARLYSDAYNNGFMNIDNDVMFGFYCFILNWEEELCGWYVEEPNWTYFKQQVRKARSTMPTTVWKPGDVFYECLEATLDGIIRYVAEHVDADPDATP